MEAFDGENRRDAETQRYGLGFVLVSLFPFEHFDIWIAKCELERLRGHLKDLAGF